MHLTFSGLDTNAWLNRGGDLRRLSEQYPIEFGVLIIKNSGRKPPIPSARIDRTLVLGSLLPVEPACVWPGANQDRGLVYTITLEEVATKEVRQFQRAGSVKMKMNLNKLLQLLRN